MKHNDPGKSDITLEKSEALLFSYIETKAKRYFNRMTIVMIFGTILFGAICAYNLYMYRKARANTESGPVQEGRFLSGAAVNALLLGVHLFIGPAVGPVLMSVLLSMVAALFLFNLSRAHNAKQ